VPENTAFRLIQRHFSAQLNPLSRHDADTLLLRLVVSEYRTGIDGMMNDARNPHTLWETAYGQLQLQMPREAFDTWLRGAKLLAHEDGTYILGVPNIYAREWLEHRLKKVIVRTLSQVAGRTVEIRFVLWSDHKEEAEVAKAGPLLADLKATEEPVPVFQRLTSGETGLNPRYTLDAYAVGPSNRLACAAAQAVIEAPAMQFNPLYLHSSVGLGKTHLLHAVGNASAALGRRVLFISSETFTNDLIAAIRAHKTNELREKYRTVDILLIDDIQFIAGKDSTQEEFYHTFNALFDSSAQIVIASNEPPSAIRRLDERLASRFEGGLVVEIQQPDFDTRLEILRIKAEMRGFDERIPLEVLEIIAEETEGSVRDLEGALNRIIATAMLNNEVPSLGLAERALQQIADTRAQSEEPAALLAIPDIINAVADFYGVSPQDIAGRDRSREVSNARQVVMYLAREEAGASLVEIGEALGGRNHSTVLYSYERVADLAAADSQVKRHIQTIMQALRGQPVSQSRSRRR
jgi:chromosomal replication initiator protein